MASVRREVVQVTVRVPVELHRRVRRVVFEQDTSTQAVVVDLLVRYVEHHEGKGVRRGGSGA